ncbi:putative SWEET sugar transporter [Helianthus anomalus]
MASLTDHLPAMFGILGNIISFGVFLAPLPTFYRIYLKKSTQGFQSIPYSVALFSCMLLLYYGCIKAENGTMIITINSVGCIIETAYLVFFLIYATRESFISTTKTLVMFNTISFGLIVSTTLLVTNDASKRVEIVGWICAIFSVCVFAAPLSIMRLVIRTKSVEYMPFSLSFFLTLCAVVWFIYGLLIKDYYVATPNVLGFLFGVAQMILYMMYKPKKVVQPKPVPLQIVVDLGAILERPETYSVGPGVGPKPKDKDEVEIRVEVEMHEKPVDEDDGGEEIKECMGKVCVDLGGEMTIVPSIPVA